MQDRCGGTNEHRQALLQRCLRSSGTSLTVNIQAQNRTGVWAVPGIVGLHICFDEQGREIEVLDVTPVAKDKYRIEETPIFNPGIALGDVIRVREQQGIAYYVETVQKSGLVRYAWLLSKEAAASPEIHSFKERVTEHEGKWEQIFGGLLVIHLPKHSIVDAELEMSRIIKRFES